MNVEDAHTRPQGCHRSTGPAPWVKGEHGTTFFRSLCPNLSPSHVSLPPAQR